MFPRIKQAIHAIGEGIRENQSYDIERKRGQDNAMFAREHRMKQIHESVNGSGKPARAGAPTTPYSNYQSDEGAKYGYGRPLLTKPMNDPNKPKRI